MTSRKKSPKHWIYFKTTGSILCSCFFCHSNSNSISIPVKCAWYLHSLPIHFLIFLLSPVVCFELPITRPLFDFTRRFEISVHDCIYLFTYFIFNKRSLLLSISLLVTRPLGSNPRADSSDDDTFSDSTEEEPCKVRKKLFLLAYETTCLAYMEKIIHE